VKTTAGEHIQRKLIATHEAAAQVLKEP